MVLWIVIAVVALALAVWGFWPRAHGVSDARVLRARRSAQGKEPHITNPTGPIW